MSEILDSGARREFTTGAVRDIQTGKGRCDLLPLEVAARLIIEESDTGFVIRHIDKFMYTGDSECLITVLNSVCHDKMWDSIPDMLLDASKHYEEGLKKYPKDNWKRGIPVESYIDSAVRHYLKWLRGDTDEPHARAFAWNLMCCIWTVWNIKPEDVDHGGPGDVRVINDCAETASSCAEDINHNITYNADSAERARKLRLLEVELNESRRIEHLQSLVERLNKHMPITKAEEEMLRNAGVCWSVTENKYVIRERKDDTND